MGFEAYSQAERTYQDEVHRLNVIANVVYSSQHGDFLKTLADAWLRADMSNKRILLPAWSAIVTKYSLDKEASV